MESFGIKNFIENHKWIIIYSFIFILAFFMRYSAIQMKNMMFLDDPFSYVSSTPNNLTPEGTLAKTNWETYNFQDGKIYTGKQIKSALFAQDKSIKSIIKDLKTIRKANIERQHPTLYLSIFRIWSAGLDGLDSKILNTRGCYLNLIFFILSFFFMYKLLSLIKNNQKFIALGLFFGFVSVGSISSTMLIRPYAMQECLFIAVNYITILIAQKIIYSERISIPNVLIYSLGYSMFMLSGYFALVYTMMAFGIIGLICIIKKNKNAIIPILEIIVLTILITVLFYPGYFDLWTDNEHIGSVSETVQYFYLPSFLDSINIVLKDVKSYILYDITFYIIIVALICESVLFKWNLFSDEFNKRESIIILGLIFTCAIWAVGITYIAPYKVFRYFSSTSVIFAISLAVLLLKRTNFSTILVMAVYLLMSLFPSIVLYKDSIGGGIMPYQTVRDDANSFLTYIQAETPLVIGNPHWYNINYFTLLKNDQPVKFEKGLPKLKNKKYILIQDEHKKLPDGDVKKLNLFQSQAIYLIKNH